MLKYFVQHYLKHIMLKILIHSTKIIAMKLCTTNFKSFVETTSNKYNLKINQAIVLTTVEGLKQIDYLTAISQFTGAVNPLTLLPLLICPTTVFVHS